MARGFGREHPVELAQRPQLTLLKLADSAVRAQVFEGVTW